MEKPQRLILGSTELVDPHTFGIDGQRDRSLSRICECCVCYCRRYISHESVPGTWIGSGLVGEQLCCHRQRCILTVDLTYTGKRHGDRHARCLIACRMVRGHNDKK
jgi:hypothetical protein